MHEVEDVQTIVGIGPLETLILFLRYRTYAEQYGAVCQFAQSKPELWRFPL